MLKQLATSLILLVASTVAACGGGAKGDGQRIDVQRIEELPVKLTVRLHGDISGAIDERVLKSTFVVQRFSDPSRDNDQIMGVEVVEPVEVAGMLVKPGFAISPFNGDGRYTIKEGSPSDAVKEEEEAQRTGKPRSRSSVKVEWWPTTDVKGKTEMFWRRAKPCTATVEEDATRGRVMCPSVVDESRTKNFSFEFIWDVQ